MVVERIRMSFGFVSSYVALWIWAVFQGVLTLFVLRQVVELEKKSGIGKRESLVGAVAPRFSGIDFHSGKPLDNAIFAGRGGVILFFASYCSICRSVATSLKRSLPADLSPMIAFCTGNERESEKFGNRLGSQIPLSLRGAEDVAKLYQVSSYPTAVIVDQELKIRDHRAIGGAEELRQLLARSAGGYINQGELALSDTGTRQSA
jgi:hypothetical protein